MAIGLAMTLPLLTTSCYSGRGQSDVAKGPELVSRFAETAQGATCPEPGCLREARNPVKGRDPAQLTYNSKKSDIAPPWKWVW